MLLLMLPSVSWIHYLFSYALMMLERLLVLVHMFLVLLLLLVHLLLDGVKVGTIVVYCWLMRLIYVFFMMRIFICCCFYVISPCCFYQFISL